MVKVRYRCRARAAVVLFAAVALLAGGAGAVTRGYAARRELRGVLA